MALDIDKLKAAFKKKSEESSGDGNSNIWDNFYPFFRMKDDEQALFRFLPDKDKDNPLGFIVENVYHQLMINGKRKNVGCSSMYGHDCEFCKTSRKYYDADDKITGKQFWRRVDYIAQGLVIQSPFDIDEKDNSVRLISIGPQLFKIIESKIMMGDLDAAPYDLEEGYDFRIIKTKKGEYSEYTTSDFKRKSTPADPELMSKAELFDLKDYRYHEVSQEQAEAMIQAVLTGASYENEKSSSKTSNDTGSSSLDKKLDDPTSKSVDASEILNDIKAKNADDVGEAKSGKASANDILARLKAKNAQ